MRGVFCPLKPAVAVTGVVLAGAAASPLCLMDTEGETEVLEVDCTEARTRTVQLQKGYVSAQLARHDPTGAWTGGVGGILVTVR